MKATPEQIAVVEKMRTEMERGRFATQEERDSLTAVLDELKALREDHGEGKCTPEEDGIVASIRAMRNAQL